MQGFRNSIRPSCAVAFVLIACVAPIARAGEVISIQAAQDATLYQDISGTIANGAGEHMFAGRTHNNGVRRALVRFDVAAVIPAGATIDSVSLRLYMSRTNSGASMTGLHRVTSSWHEGPSDAGEPGGSGTFAMPGDVTWLHRDRPGLLWTTPGGDFAASASATTNVTGINFYTWNSTTALVADLQGWLDNPSNNFGWLLRGSEGSSSAKRFSSRENLIENQRPRLTIEYTIPEPATGLLLLPGIILMRRRRAKSQSAEVI